jgi:glycine/D-amino acid oxidase-like deaminating enzyme
LECSPFGWEGGEYEEENGGRNGSGVVSFFGSLPFLFRCLQTKPISVNPLSAFPLHKWAQLVWRKRMERSNKLNWEEIKNNNWIE